MFFRPPSKEKTISIPVSIVTRDVSTGASWITVTSYFQGQPFFSNRLDLLAWLFAQMETNAPVELPAVPTPHHRYPSPPMVFSRGGIGCRSTHSVGTESVVFPLPEIYGMGHSITGQGPMDSGYPADLRFAHTDLRGIDMAGNSDDSPEPFGLVAFVPSHAPCFVRITFTAVFCS